jgi:hypothetical protein
MSELQRAAVGLMAAGLLGAVWLAVYLLACSWADWELIPARRHARLHGLQRRAPRLIAAAGTLLGVGILLGVVTLVGADGS